MMVSRLSYAAILFLVGTAAARGENWPGWRGPRGDGTSLEDKVPVRWDGTTGENIAWKVEIPGAGHASPIVWEDRVFLASCLSEQRQRVLLCLDRRTGTPLWQRVVLESPLETKHDLNSFASGTPTTDGKRIYVTFLEVDGSTIPAPNVGTPRPVTPGRMVVAAYDFAGELLWTAKPGEFISAHGFCTSPLRFEDLVIVNGDHDGNAYVAALDAATGEVRWNVKRKHTTRSYVTPIIREVAGRTQMVFSGNESIVSLNPRDGSLHWEISGPAEQFVASMVDNGQLFFMTAGYPTHHVMGIRPDGSGDVTQTHVSWHVKNAACYVPSPVVVGEYLLVADDRGTANCFDTATGNRWWQQRVGSHFSSSLVTAGGLVYFLADDGVMKVVKPGEKFEEIAKNPLGEDCYASPAISQGQILVRARQNLYCIGKPVE